jgi:hypothetical protein
MIRLFLYFSLWTKDLGYNYIEFLAKRSSCSGNCIDFS